jgi:CRISPR-associated endonuclease Csy4
VKYYVDITLIPQVEIPIHVIWSRLYTQMHLALVGCKDKDESVPFGLSFPEYRHETDKRGTLGRKLRLFASGETELHQLDLHRTLARLADYVHIKSVQEVNAKNVKGYLNVRRYHPKFDIEKVAARFAAHQLNKHNRVLTQEEAVASCVSYKKKVENLPFIRLQSLSTQRTFDLFIEQRNVTDSQNGRFSTYGLSHSSTVPLI